MNRNGYLVALEHFNLAQEHMRSLHLPDIEADDSKIAWRYFLEESSLIYNKLKASCKNGPSKGWYDRQKNTRSNDGLLSYLLHARNAATHEIEVVSFYRRSPDVIFSIPGARWIAADAPSERNRASYDAKGNAVLRTYGNWIVCDTVVDRGKVYPPPTSHLGQKVMDHTVWTIGELCLAFQRNMLAEAHSLSEMK